MPTERLEIIGVKGIPEVRPGDSLADLIAAAIRRQKLVVCDRDVLVVAHKIVSKAEGSMVRLDSVTPSARAVEFAGLTGRDPRIIEVALQQSRRIVRMAKGVLITQTCHGFVCANSGVDTSNVPPGYAVLLPEHPDRSATRLREALRASFGVSPAVIISDTFGRPWREGLVNIAVGIDGLPPLVDHRGQSDSYEKPLLVSVIAAADELASSAELVMGKNRGVPVALIHGFDYHEGKHSVGELIRPAERDLFR